MGGKKSIDKSLDEVAKKISDTKLKGTKLIQWNQDRIEDLKGKSGKVGSLPLDLLKTNKNIRKVINEEDEDFKNLVTSISKHGILQPPVVTVYTNEHGVHSVLVVGGERRIRAARSLGYKDINCLVKQFDSNETRITASMAENLNRKSLDPIDIADCYFELNKKGYKQSELVKMFGRDRKTIGRYIKIAQWPEEVKDLIRGNLDKISVKYLMLLASKVYTDAEILAEITKKIGRISSGKIERKKPLNSRMKDYFHENNLSKKEIDLITNALIDLKLLKESSVNQKTC